MSYLLARGADVELPEAEWRYTPLVMALLAGNELSALEVKRWRERDSVHIN